MTILLGVDAGGTRTTTLVARGDQVIARATGSAGAVRPGRAFQAATRIAAVARHALTEAGLLQAGVLTVGAAGVGREPERTELREGLRTERLADRVVVTGDLDIALQAAFGDGPGIVLLSGTGSVAVARTPDGTVHRRGGYGWQIGDEGSGFAIGRAALAAVSRARDGRGPASALSDAVLQASPASDFDGLIRWTTTADPAEIAALAPSVFRAAHTGDPVAQGIVAAAAEELAALVESLASLLGDSPAIPLALAGGNLDPGRGLRPAVLEVLEARPRFAIRTERLEPAEGALALARKLAG
ncbi:MAG: N-acetylglucosamine kinase [Gemmatimonadales bacterium]